MLPGTVAHLSFWFLHAQLPGVSVRPCLCELSGQGRIDKRSSLLFLLVNITLAQPSDSEWSLPETDGEIGTLLTNGVKDCLNS
jgi:hypothetical protein